MLNYKKSCHITGILMSILLTHFRYDDKKDIKLCEMVALSPSKAKLFIF